MTDATASLPSVPQPLIFQKLCMAGMESVCIALNADNSALQLLLNSEPRDYSGRLRAAQVHHKKDLTNPGTIMMHQCPSKPRLSTSTFRILPRETFSRKKSGPKFQTCVSRRHASVFLVFRGRDIQVAVWRGFLAIGLLGAHRKQPAFPLECKRTLCVVLQDMS